jgi:hypothetical protein
VSEEGGAESGALATALGPDRSEYATLMNGWPTLPEPIRAGILAIVRAASPRLNAGLDQIPR